MSNQRRILLKPLVVGLKITPLYWRYLDLRTGEIHRAFYKPEEPIRGWYTYLKGRLLMFYRHDDDVFFKAGMKRMRIVPEIRTEYKSELFRPKGKNTIKRACRTMFTMFLRNHVVYHETLNEYGNIISPIWLSKMIFHEIFIYEGWSGENDFFEEIDVNIRCGTWITLFRKEEEIPYLNKCYVNVVGTLSLDELLNLAAAYFNKESCHYFINEGYTMYIKKSRKKMPHNNIDISSLKSIFINADYGKLYKFLIQQNKALEIYKVIITKEPPVIGKKRDYSDIEKEIASVFTPFFEYLEQRNMKVTFPSAYRVAIRSTSERDIEYEHRNE